MNRHTKNLLSKPIIAKNIGSTLPKIDKINIINLIKYEVYISYNYPLMNKEHREQTESMYSKLYIPYIKNKCPEYYFTILDLNKHGINYLNIYTKIAGWYFYDEEYNENYLNTNNVDDLVSQDAEQIDIILIFYINECNENIIDKKINDLHYKYNIKNIQINKKKTYINKYVLNPQMHNMGYLLISQDPFDLSKYLYIYIYGICAETNTYISYASYIPSIEIINNINSNNIYLAYYKYFYEGGVKNDNFEIIPTTINNNIFSKYNDTNKINKVYGLNNFIFIDKNFQNNIDINEIINIPSDILYEYKLLNFIELIDLPNNVKLNLRKIRFKNYYFILHEESGSLNINDIYKFINNSTFNNFFIVKENIQIKNEKRIKILKSNLKYEPLKISTKPIFNLF